MLRHIVLFKRKSNITKDSVREDALVARMNKLGAQIPGIREWRVGVNELVRPISWDLVLESAVDDSAALDIYLFHPLHQALVADLKLYFDWAAVDYTV